MVAGLSEKEFEGQKGEERKGVKGKSLFFSFLFLFLTLSLFFPPFLRQCSCSNVSIGVTVFSTMLLWPIDSVFRVS